MLPSWYKYFNYGSIAVIAVMLLLMVTNSVPTELFRSMLFFAIGILLLRVIFRIYFVVKSKKMKEE